MEQTEIEVRSLYERHARSCDSMDFQGHVMRVTMDQDQMALMVEGIGRGLDIGPEDILLDLCCGNGAVTDPVFARCRGGLGIDFTPYLIEVAKINFEKLAEGVRFLTSEAADCSIHRYVVIAVFLHD